MAYDRDDIEKIRQSINIMDLVEAVTTVKKRGTSIKAVCPFHQEKTPSMSLSPARGFYHCFGCGVGGDIFKFVMEIQALDFNEAVELLAAQAGVVLRVDPGTSKHRDQRNRHVEAMEAAVAFYADRLKAGPDAGVARAYLRGRGYGVDVVDEFQLGYSPSDRSALVKKLTGDGFSKRDLADVGLVNKGGGDWFRGRVMFPIRDLRGDAVGFGARVLGGDGPKYLNTPETRLYQKSTLLYGLDKAKANITRQGYSIVVEGYTDVIALHRAGMPLAVASCGTALGEDHFKLLRRFSEKIVLAFDADQAGVGAAIRGDELHLPAELGLDLRVARMPAGRDPADMVQDGDTSLLTSAIEDSKALLLFRIEREVEKFPLGEPEGRARATNHMAAMVARLSDPVMRSEYARYIAKMTGTDTDTATAAVETARRNPPKKRMNAPTPEAAPSEVAAIPGPRNGQEHAELDLLRLLGGSCLGDRPVDRDLFIRKDYRAIFDELAPLAAVTAVGEEIDLSALGDTHPDIVAFMRAVLLQDAPPADPDELIGRLNYWRLDRKISAKRDELELLDPIADEQGHSQVFVELLVLEARKRELGNE